ncbi:unnamed protein product [Ixodes pacificus]
MSRPKNQSGCPVTEQRKKQSDLLLFSCVVLSFMSVNRRGVERTLRRSLSRTRNRNLNSGGLRVESTKDRGFNWLLKPGRVSPTSRDSNPLPGAQCLRRISKHGTPASATPSVATSRLLLVDGRDAMLNTPVKDLFQALRLGSVGQHFASEPPRRIKTSAHTTAVVHQVQHFAFYFAPIWSTSSG